MPHRRWNQFKRLRGKPRQESLPFNHGVFFLVWPFQVARDGDGWGLSHAFYLVGFEQQGTI